MKRSANGLIIVLAIVALGMCPLLAEAQNRAVVIKDTSCTVLDLDGLSTFDVSNTIKVSTPSRNCNRNVSCHGDLSDGSSYLPPDQGVVFNYENSGWECRVNFDGVWMPTLNWHQVITPSGQVTLTCHFKGCGAIPDCPPECVVIDGVCYCLG